MSEVNTFTVLVKRETFSIIFITRRMQCIVGSLYAVYTAAL